MKQFRNNVIAPDWKRFTSAEHIIPATNFAGVGAISCCTMSAARDAEFQPNRHLEIAPEFLRAMLTHFGRVTSMSSP